MHGMLTYVHKTIHKNSTIVTWINRYKGTSNQTSHFIIISFKESYYYNPIKEKEVGY